MAAALKSMLISRKIQHGITECWLHEFQNLPATRSIGSDQSGLTLIVARNSLIFGASVRHLVNVAPYADVAHNNCTTRNTIFKRVIYLG